MSDGDAPTHLSIGEVLAELRDEFPDITISKIRFLESQGLVDPERTPSGYRKFYAHDLARLRWILHQQKEHFLPLKVIKERLDELPPGEEARLLDPTPATDAPAGEAARRARTGGRRHHRVDEGRHHRAAAAPAPAGVRAHAARRRGRARRRPARRARRRGAATPAPSSPPPPGSTTRSCRSSRATGSWPRHGRSTASPSYDDDALEVARIAAGFFRRGIEARHLRMYRTFAEREAVLFGQVLMPYVRQRNPEARGRLQDELVELADLGRRLRTALLREAVRETLAE